jgi:uncharacterized protein YjbI with pentapeptide repeats
MPPNDQKPLGQRLYQALPAASLITLLLAVSIPVIIALVEKARSGLWPDWSGLGDYISAPVSIPIDPSGREEFIVEFQRSKTLWDWMDLLLFPAILSVGAIWLQRWSRLSSEQRARQERELTREVEAARFRESALQTYFDRMTSLLLEKELQKKSAKDARALARARTLSLLQQLEKDGIRKGALILFLYETDLVSGDVPLISLSGADLSGVELRGADLSNINLDGASMEGGQFQGAHLENAFLMNSYLAKANLAGAYLARSRLEHAYLLEADLSGADMHGASLKDALVSEEVLQSAYSLHGATMVDGTPYNGSYHLVGDMPQD